MSPEATGTDGELPPLALRRPPSAVRIHAGGLDELGARLFEEGLRAARAEGEARGRAAAAGEAARALEEAARQHAERRAEAEASLAKHAVELALVIAGELLQREVRAGAYDLEELVLATLRASEAAAGSCTLHLNPADVLALESTRLPPQLRVEAAAEVPRGHVRLATPDGFLVRDLDESLADLAERLREEAG